MKLDELVNKFNKNLSSNDFDIVDNIKNYDYKNQSLTCQSLADACHISRATLLRFCRKIGINSFSELKFMLKSQDKNKTCDLDIELISKNYHLMIDETKNYEFEKVCSYIYRAQTIFIYGTGNEQKAVAEEFKRMFLSVRKCVIDLFDLGEVNYAKKVFKDNDLFVIISLSGETIAGIDILNEVKKTKINTLSITRWDNNSISELCGENLYVGTKVLHGNENFIYEMMTAFYVLLDILFVHYLEYTRSLHFENRTTDK